MCYFYSYILFKNVPKIPLRKERNTKFMKNYLLFKFH